MNKHCISLIFHILVILFIVGCDESGKALTKLDDLKNVSIGAMTGSTGEHLAITRFPEAQTKSFDDIMDGIAALKSGQLDAIITAFPTALNVCKHNSELMIIDEPVDYENTAIAIKKGNEELLNAVNNLISQLKNDGTLKDMKKRWLKNDLTPYEEIDLSSPVNGKILKIGVSATREPFCFVDENQRVTGHDGELARRIGANLNRPIKFYDMKFSALIPALESGKIDMIVTGMTATEERAKSVNFTTSYFQNSQVIIVNKSSDANHSEEIPVSKVSPIDDYKNKRIGVILGSTHDAYAINNFPESDVLQFKTPTDIMLAIKIGKLDAAIYMTETLQEMIRQDDSFTLIGDTLYASPVGMGFNKNNDELREKFNEFLKKIKSNGVYDDIVNRWIVEGKTDMPEIKNPNPKGILNVGIMDDKGLPFVTLINNKTVGFDVEFAERFAAYLGKELKLSGMDFGSLIAAAATGKIDMISCTVVITEERKKQIDFSDPYYKLGASLFGLKKNIDKATGGKIKVLDDIADKIVGVYAGTIHDTFVEENYPNAQIKRFNSPADIILSLKKGKTDAAFLDLISAKVMLKSNPDIGILSEDVLTLPVAVGFNKNNPELREKFNEYLKEIKGDGTYDEMFKRWMIDDPELAKVPEIKFDTNAPEITLAVSVGDLPNSAVIDGEHVGFDIELVKTFAKRKGYSLKIIIMEFPSLIAALSAGKADIIADGMVITEERKKRVSFSDSYNMFKTAVLVLNKNLARTTNEQKENAKVTEPLIIENTFLQDIVESFNSNIMQERRYLLILNGLQTTIIISVLATLFGTLLGGLICFMRMSRKKLLQVPSKIYISILRGTPVLVVLMIIFYVVFASIDIDPVFVAVIAFGLNFAAYVSEMFRTGIEGVDRGQTEAGIAIGFTKVKTFIYIVMPQAVRRILPVYKGEMISLVKMTSIVGYIAVQDLTKASDIIRSRTFDAFFPLIMVAVLYFIISWLLMVSLGYVERLTNPKMKTSRS